MNESHDSSGRCNSNNSPHNTLSKGIAGTLRAGAMDCLPLSVGVGTHHPHLMASSNTVNVTVAPTSAIVAANYHQHHPHHMNLNHHLVLGSPHLGYTSSYGLSHHASSGGGGSGSSGSGIGISSANSHHHHQHHHVHSEQTKSLQELQHEVGALLEFRDLVIETFPDLKHKMASISSAASNVSSTGCVSGLGGGSSSGVSANQSVSVSGSASATTLTSGCTLVSRREWEPGIRVKRKVSQKELNHPSATDLTSSSSLTRSRSNSHSGKKEPKSSSGVAGAGSGVGGAASGETNNGSVVQDSGFSTETSSSKEGHSASSTNGGLTGTIASNRLSCPESDDELLNLLDVIHRKSSRLRDEVEHLQNYERHHLRSSGRTGSASEDQTDQTVDGVNAATALSKSSSSSANTALTPKTFREHVERLNKEDLQQLRKERDRLLDKLAEMEAETLTGRIKATKMSEQVEELIKVKKELEEQLKLAMAQRLELNSRVQQLQQQQPSRNSNSHSDFSSPRTFLSSSATTVLSTASTASSRQQNTFQPVVVEQQQQQQHKPHTNSSSELIAFHQSPGSDTKPITHHHQQQQFTADQLGRLDGIVSTPADIKCRVTDSKRFAAILLETSVIELQRHLLTLTVKNQILMQKLEAASKSKCHLVKRLDKSKDDVEDLRFQLEEKNIELEGTKAQLRVLESRLHSITPSSGAATNSYLHSQNDYETNRSSASTTLMLSRRDGGRGVSGLTLESSSSSASHPHDLRSSTPTTTTTNGQMPQPITTQISTPSMKAMTHLPMDDMQHHSSSTESAHEHDEQHDVMSSSHMVGSAAANKLENGRDMRQILMSTSVGGISPFEQQLQQQQVAAIRNHVQALKKFSGVTTSKPSKIPLPGSKAAAYFAGKPPSGRPSTAGRSPPSANSSASSQSRSPLSRSTGNLLYSKSPNSLKRADSAQSIRKDISSSFSTNTSRSSTSSSIPLATTPYSSASKSYGGGGSGSITANTNTNNNNTLNSPSSRILQNSPLPKQKRESLSAKVRQMDSLSRAYNQTHHHQQQSSNHHQHHTSNGSNNSDNVSTSTLASSSSPVPNNGGASYLVSSTPKPTSIAAQLTTSLRKDLQLSSSSFPASQPPFQRRATSGSVGFGQANTNSNTNTNHNGNGNPVAARRFSTASAVGARAARQAEHDAQHHSNVSGGSGVAISSHSSGGGGGGTASDSDSGKNFSFDKNYGHIKEIKSGLIHYFEEDLIDAGPSAPESMESQEIVVLRKPHVTLSQYFERELLKETSSTERIMAQNDSVLIYDDSQVVENNDEEIDFYTSYASYMSSSDPGSDNILVTIDYGSMETEDLSLDSLDIVQEEEDEDHKAMEQNIKPMDYLRVPSWNLNKMRTPHSKDSLKKSSDSLLRQVLNPFQVHHMQHSQTITGSSISLVQSLESHNVDTSGDYGSWQQQSESEFGDTGTPREYRYEDLIKEEEMRYDGEYNDDDYDAGNDDNGENGDVGYFDNFNYDVALSARWSSDNDKLYYRSVDYLN
ncbi:bromodomain-containing protein DDB_G0270170 isoform X2 [Stomoxys calcitrans]|uniref:bromodomain-containing protein DDB_G0270170 isoform X2 n=1 Tax=Stomoxys calcitrans TaxID=35570 RepID=UPI0027E34438|nr:bromodomain-containing protein DDB_G0270170 isoform X2 [Stomoxys calcitrans]